MDVRDAGEAQEGTPVEEGEVAFAGVGWTEALEAQFGSAPWWLVSVVLHMVVLLALGLVVVSQPPLEITDVIKTIDFIPDVDPPKPVTRALFEKPVTQKHNLIPVPEDLYTMITHTEPELPDEKLMTDNNCPDDTARGHEDAISDIPLGKQGVVGNFGVGGGGAGAYGFKGRGGRMRTASMRIGPGGVSVGVIPGVTRGLDWLARHQEPDGRWDGERFGGKNTDVGITGLATLAFLGAGHSERARTRYQRTVVSAIGWLIKQQQADGCIGRG
jgi:hypothetical protein